MTQRRRTWDTGLVRPYREPPVDFRERFLELGQSKELEEHYRTNWRVVRRWVELSGGDALREERARVAGTTLRPALRKPQAARRYVLGRTLRTVKPIAWPIPAPTFFDAGLVAALPLPVTPRQHVRRITPMRAAEIVDRLARPDASAEFVAGLQAASAALRALTAVSSGQG